MTKGARQLREHFDRPKKKDVARRLRIGSSMLSLLASGKRTPSMELAGRIEKELGIAVDAWVK